MKNTFATLLLVLIAAFNWGTLSAQDKIENTVLWEVSKKGMKQPSYLFGTFHMMCKDDFKMSEKMKNALSKTNQTVLEINFSSPDEMMSMQKYLTSDKKISEQLNPKELERFKQGLQNFGYELEHIDSFSPLMLYSTLNTKYFDCEQSDMKMLDLEIMNLTLKAKKSIKGLETIKDQVGMFNNYLNIQELLKLVENYEEGKAGTYRFLEVYKSENLSAMKEIFEGNEYMDEEQKEMMLFARNKNWMEEIPRLMEETSTFFAVGAGHLIGEKGLINLLREQGYTVKPVMK